MLVVVFASSFLAESLPLFQAVSHGVETGIEKTVEVSAEMSARAYQDPKKNSAYRKVRVSSLPHCGHDSIERRARKSIDSLRFSSVLAMCSD